MSSPNLIFKILISLIIPVSLAALLYRLEPFHAAHFPDHHLSSHVVAVPATNSHLLTGSEKLAVGKVKGAEDFAYDSELGVIYTGCADGWIKKIKLSESADDILVEDWIHTHGRPLGLALASASSSSSASQELIVADAYQGLLSVKSNGSIELLAMEAEGLKFKLTDGVDVAEDGVIYFTDASYKYDLEEVIWDVMEGIPHGRLISYDPRTKQTTVLVRDLYFANGVAVSPDQTFVVFCESIVRRCRAYYIQGPKKGNVEKFIEHLPGIPDNIRYDGEGKFWIGFASSFRKPMELMLRYPLIRKVFAMVVKHVGQPGLGEKDSGVLAVDLEGKPIAHYHDPGLSHMTVGIKIGNYLYCGFLHNPHILRLDINRYPATAKATSG